MCQKFITIPWGKKANIADVPIYPNRIKMVVFIYKDVKITFTRTNIR